MVEDRPRHAAVAINAIRPTRDRDPSIDAQRIVGGVSGGVFDGAAVSADGLLIWTSSCGEATVWATKLLEG